MWKIFVIIAAVALVATALIGYQNKGAFEREVRLSQGAEKKMNDALERIGATNEELKKTTEELAAVKEMPAALATEMAKIESATAEQDKKKTELDGLLDQLVSSIAAVKDLVDSLGPIEGISKEMAALDADLKAAEQETINERNNLEGAKQRIANLNSRIASYAAVERGQITGDMKPGIRALVETANNQWGFVVLSAGERQGLVPKAELAVARGGYQICRLIITSLEPNRSVASIVPGTVPNGYYVVAGDLAIVVPKTAPAPGTDS